MLEWLAGDPLVGMLTATGFVIFLLIGRELKIRQMKRKNVELNAKNVELRT